MNVDDAWRKLYNNYLWEGAKDTLAGDLENKIHDPDEEITPKQMMSAYTHP